MKKFFFMFLFLFSVNIFATGECLQNPCGNGTCTEKFPRGYSCSCPTGYYFNGTTCVDNPCDPSCGANSSCVTQTLLGGGYNKSCVCNSGYYMNSSGQCVIDKCFNNPCGVNGTCSRTTTSYICSCNSGYFFDRFTCWSSDKFIKFCKFSKNYNSKNNK